MFPRTVLASLGAIAVGTSASNAWATPTYNVQLTGHLISQLNPGVDPGGLQVGTLVTLTASFTPDFVGKWGDTGYEVAGTYKNFGAAHIPTFSITAGNYTWYESDEEDGHDVFYDYSNDDTISYSLGGEGIVFKDGKVAGLIQDDPFYPAGPTAPAMNLGGPAFGTDYLTRDSYCFPFSDPACHGPLIENANFSPLPIGFGFSIMSAPGYYGNFLTSPGFSGVWDFETSSVRAPEPGTWAMMIMGLGAVGAMARRRPARGGRRGLPAP